MCVCFHLGRQVQIRHKKKLKMTKLSILALSGHIMADERFYVNVDRIDRRAIQEFRDFLDREVFCEGNEIFLNIFIT